MVKWLLLIAIAILVVACGGSQAKLPGDPDPAGVEKKPWSGAKDLEKPPRGPFGLSLVTTGDGGVAGEDAYTENEECGGCHERVIEELSDSMHRVAHTDPLYRATAELARKEAGQEVYAYCSGCHSPQGVTRKLIPDTPEEDLPEIARGGILCDVCHQTSDLTGVDGPWKEPGNASFVLDPDQDRKFGAPGGVEGAADHTVEVRDHFKSSEFCASCHTVIHPGNGVRIEHTYAEWKNSVYAEKGIQCQDCHMRSAEDAIQVARTLSPVSTMGTSVPDGDQREISSHKFVGANINSALFGGSEAQARDAEKRLNGAATMDLRAPENVGADDTLEFEIVITNVGAGHNLPTSLTELREIWVQIAVTDVEGKVIFESGKLDGNGDIQAGSTVFGAHGGDADGKLTYKPWEVTGFIFKRLIPPKGSDGDKFRVALPGGTRGPLKIDAKLLYRGAPPKVAMLLLGEQADRMRTIEMTSASASVQVSR